jgi:Ca2+-dependent lipid-binding protein
MLSPPEHTQPVAAGMIRRVTLEITVFDAAHLPKMDQLGKCDAFCTLQWADGERFETKTIPKTYEPVWEESHHFKPFQINGAAPPQVPAFSISLVDYNSPTSQELFGAIVLQQDLMEQVGHADAC